MGKRFGEDAARPVDSIRRVKGNEREFIELGNEEDAETGEPVQEPEKRKRGRPRKYPRKGTKDAKTAQAGAEKPVKRKNAKRIESLSDFQIDDATDRVIMGESIAKVAEELNVNAQALALKIKKRVGMLYMRKWQQSVAYDCLRAEMLLKASMRNVIETEDPRWVANGLKVLEYRAKVLGFGAVNPQDQSLRVAGLSQEEVFDAILEKL